MGSRQASQMTSFRKYDQKWNYTDLQNYQMDKFYSKVRFLLDIYNKKAHVYLHLAKIGRVKFPKNVDKNATNFVIFFSN